MNLKNAKYIFEQILEISYFYEWDEFLLNLCHTPDAHDAFLYFQNRFGVLPIGEFRSKDVIDCVGYWLDIFEEYLILTEDIND